MSIVDDLIDKPGTLAVGGFGRDGSLTDFDARGSVEGRIAPMASQFAATVEMLMGTFGASFSEITGLPMVPFYGWVYSGGEMTSIIQGSRFALLRTDESEFRARSTGDGPLLSELLARPGVRLAAYHTPDGREIAHAQSVALDREVRRTLTEIVASSSTAFRGLATAFSQLTKSPWTPLRTWVYSGGDWSIAASECCWLLGEAGEANAVELHHALMR